MTIDEQIRIDDKEAINQALGSLPDSAFYRRIKNRLRRLALRDPREFWIQYLDFRCQPSPEVAALVRSGAVNEQTTFAELPAIVDAARRGEQ